MLTESRHATTVTTEHLKLAHSVAINYRHSHPQLDYEDCISIANLTMCEMTPALDSIPDVIRNALRVELHRVGRYAKRHEAIAFDESGEPLPSMRSLREAQSLNPAACLPDGGYLKKAFLGALSDVCESAIRQNCQSHARHFEYVGDALSNRRLVSGSQKLRNRRDRIRQHEDLRALKRAA